MQRRQFVLSLLAAAAPLCPGRAAAAGPLKLIVPFVAGGGNDIYARLYAPVLGHLLGETVIVDNRSGASGTIGATYVAQSAPDGQTVLHASSAIAITPAILPSVAFDPARELLPVTQATSQPLVMVVRKEMGIGSLKALLDFARRDKSLSFGSASQGSPSHLAPALLFKRAQVPALGVAYRGAGQLMTAILGGEVHVAFLIPPLARQYVAQGKLIALATSGANRIVHFADVPTLQEQGFPGLVADQWHGFFMPAQTPPGVATRFQQALAAVLRDADVTKHLADDSASVVASTPAQFKAYFGSEVRRWKAIVEETGVKPQA